MESIDNKCVNAIRVLSADMAREANSGHPGLPFRNSTYGEDIVARVNKHFIFIKEDEIMVVKSKDMAKQVRKELKGGNGDIYFLNCVDKDTIPNCRLLSFMTVPSKGSIGEHEHVKETECYVIRSGKGTVIDNGKKIDIEAGDVVLTGDGDIHSIINTGEAPLEILAFIVMN